jgi:hypothetical protein
MLTNDTTDDIISVKLMRLFFLCENNIKEEAKINTKPRSNKDLEKVIVV